MKLHNSCHDVYVAVKEVVSKPYIIQLETKGKSIF